MHVAGTIVLSDKHMNKSMSTDKVQEESKSQKEACGAQGHFNHQPCVQMCAPHVL